MAFTEDQFQRLLEMVIRIDENTKNNAKFMDDHTRDDIAQFALSNKAVEAVHSRLDKIKTELEVEKKAVKVEWDRAIGFQNKLMGAIAVLVFIIPFVVKFLFNT